MSWTTPNIGKFLENPGSLSLNKINGKTSRTQVLDSAQKSLISDIRKT